MPLIVKCFRCKEELEEAGALLFGPPDDKTEQTSKIHLCVECYEYIRSKIL